MPTSQPCQQPTPRDREVVKAVLVVAADRNAFWGEFTELVDVRLDESAKNAELQVAEAIIRARLDFEQRFSEVDSATRTAMLATIVETYAPERYEQTLFDCPACHTTALVYGSYHSDWEPDWELGDDGEPWSPGAYLS